jgi:molybdopterin-containing oxidoreductase family membrane subunit
MYVLIIGGQAYPLEIFPGMESTSSFFDGAFSWYTPSLPELALGIGGIAIAGAIVTLAVKVLGFLPESVADADLDPHYRPVAETVDASGKAPAAAKPAVRAA